MRNNISEGLSAIEQNRTFVTALARGLTILESFNDERPELGITQISKKVGLAKTSTHRLVQTLVALRYLIPSSDSTKYRLGPRVLGLGYAVLQAMDLKTVAASYLQQLSDRCGETVNMASLDGTELVYIERIKTQQIININLHVGSRLPLYNTSMGRALLSYQPREWLEGYIQAIKRESEARPLIGTTGENLLKVIASVRQKKYAINDQDLAKGLRSIATPIWSAKGQVCAALNIAVPSARVTLKELESVFAPQLLKTAQEISESLGYRGDSQIFQPE